MLKLKTYSGFHELFLNLASILQDIFENTSYLLFYIYTIFLHGIAGSVLVKKILPQKRTRHTYVLSVQDWCYNTATLNVTVTENTVSMNQGKYWDSRMSLISIRLFIVLSYCKCLWKSKKVTLSTISLTWCRANKIWSACSWYRPIVFWKTRPSNIANLLSKAPKF
jgi:hypothetical protein